MESAHAAREDGRRHRADGERSRQAILTAAAELATIEGLDGLSIGRLAEHVGMSKSGVFAHFRSKEELQLATIDVAREIYEREVVEPAMRAPEGIARLRAICEEFLAHLERRVFPAGCFFISAAAELEVKHGPVRDYLLATYVELIDDFVSSVRRAQELGELDPDADVQQVVFELDSFLLGANTALFFFGDESATDRARAAVGGTLERLAPRELARRR
jgi:AcrR family transcriptional regulator